MRGLVAVQTTPPSYVRDVPHQSPAYRAPRDWIDTNHSTLRDFGRTRDLNWIAPTTDLEVALLEAAQRHHGLARGLRNYRDAEGLTTADLAHATDLSLGAVERILNGSTHLTLGRLYALAATVNAAVTASIRPR